ncbi:MAG: hypothetical protein ACKO4Z_04555 [Planctomycetota bacterium]
MTRAGVVAAVAAIVLAGLAVRPAAAAPPTDAELRALVAGAAKRPSVHADRPTIDKVLHQAGVSRATIERLWKEVDAAVLPEGGGQLEEFLRFTREPEWLALRDEFAEFLTLRGIDRIEKKTAARIRRHHGIRSFPDLTVLDVASARRLRDTRNDGWHTAIELPAVRSLTPAAAAAVANCPLVLVLPGLTDLSLETAAALADHEGPSLVLGGLRRLELPVAEALAGYPAHQELLLPDLESLDSIPLARRLAAQQVVYLPRMPRLTPNAAAALEDNAGGELMLPGLIELSEETAARLAAAGFYGITLGCGATLSPAAAGALAHHAGQIVFTGTQGLAVAAAAALDAHQGDLVLQHVARVPAAIAAALHGGDHRLVLPAVHDLDAAAAADLAGVGPLSLPSLDSLDEPSAAALADHAHLLQLDGLGDLSGPVARALGRHRGHLVLGGLETLDAATAAGLARCPGQLHLDAVMRIDRGAATMLVRRERPLEISGLQGVQRIESPEVARLIAARIDDPSLPYLTSIDGPDAVAIAAALAESRGELALPALERITARALSVLLQKREISLPALPDLEVVADPGGGADDFVDPR